MKVALVHDFLIRWGGAETVLFDLHKIFPKAPIYTLFYNKEFVKERFPNIEIKSSFIQKKYSFLEKLSKIKIVNKSFYKLLLPWMPQASEDLDFSGYDLVISSSSGFVKGIIVPSKTKHICYLHTPTRWAWQDYHYGTHNMEHGTTNNGGDVADIVLEREIASEGSWQVENIKQRTFLKRLYIHFFRIWDFEATQRPDILIVNSEYTKKRIQKYYRRETKVIYPGTKIPNSKFQIRYKNLQQAGEPWNKNLQQAGEPWNKNLQQAEEPWYKNLQQAGEPWRKDKYQRLNIKYKIPDSQYFIIISRLSPYKHIDWAIEAFCDLPYNLVIVGNGPEYKRLKRTVWNMEHGAGNGKRGTEKIFFVNFLKNKNELFKLLKNSMGLIHLAEEDFGLVILEALKLGKPVIAYSKGGTKELIKPGINGELFKAKELRSKTGNNEYDLEDLKKKIVKIAKNKNKYKPNKIKKTVAKLSKVNFNKKIKSFTINNGKYL